MSAPQPMPLISQGVPAYTNDDLSGSFPASNANNSNYHDNWRCATTPTGNANSGTLTQPVYVAYDLSGVSSTQRGDVLLAWYNDTPGIGAYNPTLTATTYYNNPNAYTIDVNAAAGGTLPTSGWVTKITETNNVYHSRQYTFNMAGYNWVRINVTAITGSVFNNNAELDMDIHDAHLGVQDSWIFYGDSITMTGLNHDDSGGMGTIGPVQVQVAEPTYYPVWEGAGIGGFTANDFTSLMSTFLPLFPGKYAAVPLGTNDANGGGSLVTNFSSNMQSIITSIAGAGKIAVIPHIPYGTTANIIANGPTINSAIDALVASHSSVCIAGPDLWSYFLNNQSLISGDGIHPTTPAGMAALRTQWVNWAVATIYSAPAPPAPPLVYVPTPLPDTSQFISSAGGTLPIKSVKAIYQSNGVPLSDQPYLATAPQVMGQNIPAGETFTLFFQSPASGTQSALANGNTVTLTFGLADGRSAHGSVLVTSSLTSDIFQVNCTVARTIPISPS